MRNRAYEGRREDGWKAEDKLSFRQQSRMCVGGKTHFVVRGQRTRGATGRCQGGSSKRGNDGGERKRGGKAKWRRWSEGLRERREGP